MPRDTILNEIEQETRVRIDQWKRERAELLKASARIAELDEMIAGAEAELESVYVRKPALRPKVEAPEVRKPREPVE
jgi:hypothetical protein